MASNAVNSSTVVEVAVMEAVEVAMMAVIIINMVRRDLNDSSHYKFTSRSNPAFLLYK
jgi:hypothetical protein